jgi:hypothetical protein
MVRWFICHELFLRPRKKVVPTFTQNPTSEKQNECKVSV